MQLTKTELAILKLLLESEEFLDAESIYLQLNATAKKHSYGSVYSALRVLHRKEALVAKRMEKERKRFFFLNKAWVAAHFFVDSGY